MNNNTSILHSSFSCHKKSGSAWEPAGVPLCAPRDPPSGSPLPPIISIDARHRATAVLRLYGIVGRRIVCVATPPSIVQWHSPMQSNQHSPWDTATLVKNPPALITAYGRSLAWGGAWYSHHLVDLHHLHPNSMLHPLASVRTYGLHPHYLWTQMM